MGNIKTNQGDIGPFAVPCWTVGDGLRNSVFGPASSRSTSNTDPRDREPLHFGLLNKPNDDAIDIFTSTIAAAVGPGLFT